MTIETLQTLSLILFIVAGLLFVAACILFFVLKIPKVFGDVTGSTAKKAIADIRRQNEISGDKAYKPSPENLKRGKITDHISPSGKIRRNLAVNGVSVGTEDLAAAPSDDQNATTVLEPEVFLNETTVLEQVSDETTILETKYNDTTVLYPTAETVQADENHADGFYIEYELGFCESTEIIE